MNGFQENVICGHCHSSAQILFDPITIQRRLYLSESGEAARPLHIQLGPNTEAARWNQFGGFCPSCHMMTFLEVAATGDDPENRTYEVRQYPAPRDMDAPTAWPTDLRTAWEDLLKMQSGGVSPASLATAAGTCLQLALRLLGAEGKTLAQEIDNLRGKNIITAELADWAHDLRQQRNGGTHDFFGDQQRISEGIDFLRMFLHLTFTLRFEIEAKRAGLKN